MVGKVLLIIAVSIGVALLFKKFFVSGLGRKGEK
jgi:hypothetical protein